MNDLLLGLGLSLLGAATFAVLATLYLRRTDDAIL